MSNNDEKNNRIVTIVSIKHSEGYIDMNGIQWRQRQAHNVYKCIQHQSIQCRKCIQRG